MEKTKARSEKAVQLNRFVEDNQHERLSKFGDPLEKLNVVNFETFRPMLKDALEKERKSNAGRPPFDYVTSIGRRIPTPIISVGTSP